MKLLLLLAFVASAYSAYFEPGERCKIDVCFLLDHSGSVGKANWDIALKFLVDFVNMVKISADDVQIGVIQFGDASDLGTFQSIDLNAHLVKADLITAINGLQYGSRGATQIDDALRMAKNQCFTSARGDRPGVNNLAIMITDGDQCCSGNEDQHVLDAAAELRKVAEIIAIGIGSYLDEDMLRKITDDPAKVKLFSQGYSELLTNVKSLVDAACKIGDKHCTGRGGVLLTTFDGLNLQITKEQKTIVARWDPSPSDKCRFQIRTVTSFDCAWEPDWQLLPLFIDWIGVSFDTAKAKIFGRRNILMTQRPTQVRIRGENIDQTVVSFPHEVDLSDGSKVLIRRENINGQAEYQVRSEVDCEWAVDWRPDVRDSEVDIYIGPKHWNVMEGMCGEADGNAPNDWKKCDGTSVPADPASADLITDSCLEGTNQGQGIEGCLKTRR